MVYVENDVNKVFISTFYISNCLSSVFAFDLSTFYLLDFGFDPIVLSLHGIGRIRTASHYSTIYSTPSNYPPIVFPLQIGCPSSPHIYLQSTPIRGSKYNSCSPSSS